MKKQAIWCVVVSIAVLCVFLGIFQIRQEGKKPPLQISVLPEKTSGATLPGLETALNINTATEEQLQKLPGVGPVLSRRIVEYREEHGFFTAIYQLSLVPGVGIGLLDDIMDYITVGG